MKKILWRRLSREKKGQGMTEYVIILALVAIAAIQVINIFGDSIKVNFGRIVAKIQSVSYDGPEFDDLESIEDATESSDFQNFDE